MYHRNRPIPWQQLQNNFTTYVHHFFFDKEKIILLFIVTLTINILSMIYTVGRKWRILEACTR